jgi:hypothetical protein
MHTTGNTPNPDFMGCTPNQVMIEAVTRALINMDALPMESRRDLVAAALDYHFMSMLLDFIELTTSEDGGRPYDLIDRRRDDKAKETVWQAIGYSTYRIRKLMSGTCDRFINLREMVKSSCK